MDDKTMNPIAPISYDQFAALRLDDFFTQGVTTEDLIDANIGSAVGECVDTHTHFLWKPKEPQRVAEIIIEMGTTADCPTVIAETIMQAVGVPMRVGQSLFDVTTQIGAQDVTQDNLGDRTIVMCQRGSIDRYELGLIVHHTMGLIQFHMTRLDRIEQ